MAGGSSTLTAPSVTTSAAPTVLVVFVSVKQGNTVSTPPGMIQEQYVNQNVTSTAEDQTLSTVGPAGTRSGTETQKASEAEAQTIALRGVSTASATLTWTPTRTTSASGNRLSRNRGTRVSLTPATLSSTTDGPLLSGVQTTWSRVTVAGSWTSTEMTTSATPS